MGVGATRHLPHRHRGRTAHSLRSPLRYRGHRGVGERQCDGGDGHARGQRHPIRHRCGSGHRDITGLADHSASQRVGFRLVAVQPEPRSRPGHGRYRESIDSRITWCTTRSTNAAPLRLEHGQHPVRLRNAEIDCGHEERAWPTGYPPSPLGAHRDTRISSATLTLSYEKLVFSLPDRTLDLQRPCARDARCPQGGAHGWDPSGAPRRDPISKLRRARRRYL